MHHSHHFRSARRVQLSCVRPITTSVSISCLLPHVVRDAGRDPHTSLPPPARVSRHVTPRRWVLAAHTFSGHQQAEDKREIRRLAKCSWLQIRDWSLITGRRGGYKMGKSRVQNLLRPLLPPPQDRVKPFSPPLLKGGTSLQYG